MTTTPDAPLLTPALDPPTVTLTVALKGADGGLRAARRFDVTDGMDTTGVWRWWRLCAAQRRTREHVHVALLVDGMPVEQWNADRTWPRESADEIVRHRMLLAKATL